MRMPYSTRIHYLNINIGWMNYPEPYDSGLRTLLFTCKGLSSPRKQYETLHALLKVYLRTDALPERIRSSLEFFVKRVHRKCCNSNVKYLYFCDRKEGHKGNHSDKGFEWKDD
jgi:hypothetical protein